MQRNKNKQEYVTKVRNKSSFLVPLMLDNSFKINFTSFPTTEQHQTHKENNDGKTLSTGKAIR